MNEDEADCQIVTEEECDTEGVCDLIPRQVCNVNSQNVTKTRPDTKVGEHAKAILVNLLLISIFSSARESQSGSVDRSDVPW